MLKKQQRADKEAVELPKEAEKGGEHESTPLLTHRHGTRTLRCRHPGCEAEVEAGRHSKAAQRQHIELAHLNAAGVKILCPAGIDGGSSMIAKRFRPVASQPKCSSGGKSFASLAELTVHIQKVCC